MAMTDEVLKKYLEKRYIGDGVYVHFDGYHVVLTTENGFETTNIIYLEDSVLVSFVNYINELEEARK